MNKKYFFSSIFVSAGIIVLALAVNYAGAQSEGVNYPIKELGDCGSEAACGTYCDKPANAEVCLNYAKQHDLMSDDEINRAQKFLDAGSGPGGCAGKDACEEYCNNISHIDECISFAEENNLMPPEELGEAKKVQAAIKRGVKPPPCGNKKQCDVYCGEADHMEECIAFAQEAGFMSPQELEDSKKVLTAIKAGATPPPCRGKAECDTYCLQEEHFDSCLNFALAAGMMDPKDAEMARKTKGKGPGGCRGKEQCDAFCQQEGNMEICAQFAYENGMMTQEEFEMFKKTKGKGPAGCKSKEECQSFCDNPDNQETCFNFAKENGLIPQEDLQRMEQVKQQFKEMLQNVPPEVYSCLESAVGPETMVKLKSGEAMPAKDMGDKMKGCFEQNIKPPEQGAPDEGGSMPPAGGGPGDMAPPGGAMSGPGGCASPEECQKYCESNPEACGNFQPPAQPMPGSGPMPCEGENCPPPGSMPPGTAPGAEPGEFRPPEGGGMTPPQGEMPPSGETAPLPSTAPGGGGNTQPGEYVPPALPAEPAPMTAPAPEPIPAPTPAPEPIPAPTPAPTSYNINSFLGLILQPFLRIIPENR